MEFEEAVKRIRERVLDRKREEAKVTPQHCLRASGFWPCDRNLYYQVHDWQQRHPPTAEQMAIFALGRKFEEIAIEDLRSAGYSVTGQQQSFELKVRNGKITGHIDGWISGNEIGDEPVPLEIKGYTYQAEQAQSWRDFLRARQPWLRQVPAQLQLYLLQAEREYGVLVMVDKKSGQLYPLPVELDYEYAESVLKRAETVYEHLEMEEPPARIPYDPDVCDHCDFAHICEPLESLEMDSEGMVFEPKIVALARRYIETEEAAREHEAARRHLRKVAEATEHNRLWVGPVVVEKKIQVRHYKAQPERDVETLTVKIKRRDDYDE